MGRRPALNEIDRQIASMTDDEIALGLADGLVGSVEELEHAYFLSEPSPVRRENARRKVGLFSLAAAEFSGYQHDSSEPPSWVKIVDQTISRIDLAYKSQLRRQLFGPMTLREAERLKRSAMAYVQEPPSRQWAGREFAAAVLLGAITTQLIEDPKKSGHLKA